MKKFYAQAQALSNKPNKIKVGYELREEKQFLWIVAKVS